MVGQDDAAKASRPAWIRARAGSAAVASGWSVAAGGVLPATARDRSAARSAGSGGQGGGVGVADAGVRHEREVEGEVDAVPGGGRNGSGSPRSDQTFWWYGSMGWVMPTHRTE